jgi:transcriptional regulator with XRE-family HTH domain
MRIKTHPVEPSKGALRSKNAPALKEPALTVRLLRWLAGGWTQEKLAVEAGVTKASISRYERGQRNPSPQTMQRVCEAAQVPYAVVEGVLRPALREVLAVRAGVARDGSSSRSAAELTDELLRAVTAMVRPVFALLVEELLAKACGPWSSDQPPAAGDWLTAPELLAVLEGHGGAGPAPLKSSPT